MTLPVTIPNTFANATTSIPLANLDANFVTIYGAVNGIGNGAEALANVNISGGTVANAAVSNTSVSATTLNTSGQVVFNDAGADVDFRVEGDTDANLLFVDASTDRVGIGTSSPGAKLDVAESQFANIPRFTRTTTAITDSNLSSQRVKTTTSLDMSDGFGTAITFAIQDSANVENDIASVGAVRSGADNSGSITFVTANAGTSAERARITSDGYLRMASGTGGIQFNGDTAAANALDDYEEGDWTPSVTSGSGSITAYTSEGKYIKIGKSVYLWGAINITNIGTASSSFFWGGAPFTSYNNSLATSPRAATFLVREDAAVGTTYQGFMDKNNTAGQVRNFDNSTFAFSNNTTYCFCFTYITN